MALTNSINCNSNGVITYNTTSGLFSASALNQFDVLLGSSSNAITSLTNGTTGQLLVANTGANPSWQTVSTGFTTIGDVTSGTVAFDGTAGNTLTGTFGGGLSLTVAINPTGTGGDISMTSGDTGGTDQNTGNAGISTPESSGAGQSGTIFLLAGDNVGTGIPGNVQITAGAAIGSSGSGGNISFASGAGKSGGGHVNVNSGNSSLGSPGYIRFTGGIGTGSNLAAQDITFTNGRGTGTGAVGKIFFVADGSGTASGSTAHTRVNRLILNGSVTSLSSGSASTVATATIASNSMNGGFIQYTIESSDGTDFQVTSGYIGFAITNKSGTISGTATIVGAEVSNSTLGTLTSSWSVTSGGLVQVTPTVTLITPTTLRITYTVFGNGQQTITVP